MRKKVIYPIVDEMNLLTLDEEEYAQAMKDFEAYVQKYCRYFHYRDKERVMRERMFSYAFPVGKKTKQFLEELYKSGGKKIGNVQVVEQSLEAPKMLGRNKV